MLTVFTGGMLLGLAVGILVGGINININHKNEPEAPQEYNKTEVNLPDEMKQYAELNKGYINY
jgi:hypothetical protein